MRTLSVNYPETIPAMNNLSPESFEAEARLAMAMKLYAIGRLTSGQAAVLADIPRVTFLLSCQRFGTYSVDWDATELVREAEELHQ